MSKKTQYKMENLDFEKSSCEHFDVYLKVNQTESINWFLHWKTIHSLVPNVYVEWITKWNWYSMCFIKWINCSVLWLYSTIDVTSRDGKRWSEVRKVNVWETSMKIIKDNEPTLANWNQLNGHVSFQFDRDKGQSTTTTQ